MPRGLSRESTFRQVVRGSDLLLKLKRQSQWKNHSEDEGTTRDVVENKGQAPKIHDLYETKMQSVAVSFFMPHDVYENTSGYALVKGQLYSTK